jgi:small subunit ribosomal protein S18
MEHVDYKDTGYLRRFMSERGKIKSRANTGTCVQHQSDIAIAIKTAREMALLPYAVRTAMGNKGGGRRGRDAGPGGRPSGRPSGPPSERPAISGDQAEGAVAAATAEDAIAPVAAAPEVEVTAAPAESVD